jgi:5'-nucleotidase
MSVMGYSAANIGRNEFHLTDSFRETLAKEARFQILSANIKGKGNSPFRRFIIKRSALPDIKKPLSVGITGVLPRIRRFYPGGGELTVISPEEALKELIPGLKKKCDIIILLSAMKMEESEELAEKVPGIDIIIGSYSSTVTNEPKVVRDTRIVYGGYEGRNLGTLFIYLDRQGNIRSIDHKLVPLSAEIADDPGMLTLISRAEEEIKLPPR